MFIYSYKIHSLQTRKWDARHFGKGLKQILRHRVMNSVVGSRLGGDSLNLVLPEAGTCAVFFWFFGFFVCFLVCLFSFDFAFRNSFLLLLLQESVNLDWKG